jgi:hypothetical protein
VEKRERSERQDSGGVDCNDGVMINKVRWREFFAIDRRLQGSGRNVKEISLTPKPMLECESRACEGLRSIRAWAHFRGQRNLLERYKG